jgi:hypothetical protein
VFDTELRGVAFPLALVVLALVIVGVVVATIAAHVARLLAGAFRAELAALGRMDTPPQPRARARGVPSKAPLA